MAKIQDVDIPYLEFAEGAAPSTPASAISRLYAKADGLLYSKDDAGTETLVSSGSASGVASGTSNPGSPTTGQLFFRTDAGLLIYYDGTQWLTATLYREPFSAEMSELAHTATAGVSGRIAPWHSTYDLYLDAFYTSSLVSTTNNGTNFWTVTLNKLNAANAATSVVSFSTGTTPDTAGTWVTRRTSIAALLAVSTYKAMKVDLTKTLSPGALIIIGHLAYRLVVT